ncbi:Holliday junction branch migration protein RuvA [Peptoniphilus sp. MSJ-1]|uniref:Holliday junction branch migration complex subunit RuvA n=1 Tax=Peptoniphilus ovalis TaxID=2841503 RepID=A0ABS6FFR8_9FIRM|nr:Holliday junction branch migration protein RuvA [Peptoniphilus ovalis]MBU5669014.1 Holliday junction branch migration protein RuvA [Peptoniphilus ovalis]
MIEFLSGKVVSNDKGYLVLENNGVGYIIYMISRELHSFYKNDEALINTRLILREDSATFYGFKSIKTRDAFDLLNTVTGIGPKLAMGILDGDEVSNILKYILIKDEKSLTKLPGVGKKTAQRIIIELKDKVEKLGIEIEPDEEIILSNYSDDDPAVEALISLGYNEFDTKKVLDKIDSNLDISDRIREALKLMG